MPTIVPDPPAKTGSGGPDTQHDDKPYDYGPPDLKPDLLQFYSFRFKAFTGVGKKTETLLTNVESSAWDDGGDNKGAVTSGTVTLRDPAYGLGTRVRLDVGDLVRCEWSGGAGWQEAWEMRVTDPALTASVWQRTYQLANDLDLLGRSTDDFLFKSGAGTAKPNGWAFNEVIAEVCRRYGVPVECPKGTYRRKKTWAWRGVSPLDAIQKAMNTERVHTGKRYSVRWARLKSGAHGLKVEPLIRNPHLLALGPSLIEAAYAAHLARGQATYGVNEGYFASALTVRAQSASVVAPDIQGHAKTSTAALKAEITPGNSAVAKKARDKYGYVHRIVWSADAVTEADLRRQGEEYLAAVAKPVKELTLTHVGIPTIRRGHAIQLGLGDAALLKQTVWVTAIQFNLQPADYTMTVTLTFDDPYIDVVGKRIQDKLFESQSDAAKPGNAPKPTKAAGRSDTPSLVGIGGPS